MRIATFNANSIRSRLDTILRWLRSHEPDVLGIQETKVRDEDFPAAPLEQAGYHVAFRGQPGYAGVALLSRTAPDKVRFGLEDGPDPDETRLLYARFGSVHVVNTYVPQGREIDHPMYRYKLEWFQRLRTYFERHFSPRMRVVWLGDLNIAPEPQDVHNPEQQATHVCFHEDARLAFRRTVEWGLVDVFRQRHPEPGQYTFYDYRGRNNVRRNMGWRVDHILTTKPLARRCTDAFIDLGPRLAARPSDHTFLCADFRV